jgi:hypothetical protein
MNEIVACYVRHGLFQRCESAALGLDAQIFGSTCAAAMIRSRTHCTPGSSTR